VVPRGQHVDPQPQRPDDRPLTTGTALYWDRYVRENGKWLIRETNYERIYEINQTLDERPNLSSHYLGVHGGEPQF